MNEKGFTLVELMISVAVVGILAAAGVVTYQNYVSDTENIDAQNALRAIYLMQLDYRADTGGYWPTPGGNACAATDCTSEINTNLFSGVITVRPDSPFDFTLQSTPTSSTAPTGFTACASNSSSGQIYRIDQNNALTAPASCP